MSLQGTQQWGSDATVGDVALPVPLAVSHIAAALRDGGGAERPQTHRAAESAPRGVPVTPRAGRPFPNPVINARRRAALSHRPDGDPQRFSRSSGQGGAGHGWDNRAVSGETEARSPGADGNGAAAGSSPPPPPRLPRSAPAALCGLRRSISAIPGTRWQLQPGRQLPVARPPSRKAAHETPPGSQCRERGG